MRESRRVDHSKKKKDGRIIANESCLKVSGARRAVNVMICKTWGSPWFKPWPTIRPEETNFITGLFCRVHEKFYSF